MGVPSFYRWLLDSYPLAVVDAESAGEDQQESMAFDNLYLDMNGIVHPCFHPEGMPAPKTYEEVFESVFKYIDALFAIVRPRKLLYLAVDGVAPRAKMNQQRSRRFRAAKDAAEEAAQKEEIVVNVSESEEKSTCLEQSSKLDSNVITPGTEFMALLSSALQYYIHLRMNEEPRWQRVKVILSDASVPGEGEHKIMSYIRLQRNLPGYDPNTRHCLYGLDADLIMLALATHEIHFSILREDVRRPGFFPKSGRDSSRRTRKDVGRVPEKEKIVYENIEDYISKMKFQFLHVWILREYLAYAMKIPDRSVKVDLERLIDDFVLMCLLVGNDFLPHVPALEISEGAIDLLMEIYKKEFVKMGGYLTNSFEVNLSRMKHFLEAVGSHEGAILRKRMQRKRGREVLDRNFSRNTSSFGRDSIKRKRGREVLDRNFSRNTSSFGRDSIKSHAQEGRAPTRSATLDTCTVVDKIKYGEVGWKERYYAEKFKVETEDDCERIRRDVVLKYAEGICWVMHYYYQGVCSWQWFYPYHYAPFASDFLGIENLKIEFALGQPFKPIDQLMAVLPSASAHAVPMFYRKLMTEASSPLLAFYPTDFEIDMNGKRFSWQGICKLPFIEESLLLSEIARVEHTLTDEERQRNQLGLDVLFVHISDPLAGKIVSFFERNIGHPKLAMAKVKRKIDPRFSAGMNGYMVISDKPVQPEQIDSPIDGMQMIANNNVLSVLYGYPPFHEHISRLPEGVAVPNKFIRKRHIKPKRFLWHEEIAVVGRLHSELPIRKSIFGSRLAKAARQLVLTWCLQMQRKSTGSLECGEGFTASADIASLEIVCPGDGNRPASIPCTVETTSIGHTSGDKSCANTGDGKSSTRKNRRRKWRLRRRLSNHSADAKGTVLVSNLQGTASACDIGDDKSYSIGQSDRQAVVVPDNIQGRGDELTCQSKVDQTDGNKSSINSGSAKHKGKQKRNKGNTIPNGHADGLSCHVNLEKGICTDGTRGEETIADESRKEAVGVPDNKQGGDRSSIDGESGQRGKKRRRNTGNIIVPSFHLNLENGICADEAQVGKTKAVESSKQAPGVPDNSQGREELTCQLHVDQTAGGKSSIHEGTDGLSCLVDLNKGNCADEVQGEKTIADESRKEDAGVQDNNKDRDKLTCELQLDQAAGDESNIDGGSGRCKKKRRWNKGNTRVVDEHEGACAVTSHLNLKKGIAGDEAQREKTIAVELSKQAPGVVDNYQGGDELVCQLQMDTKVFNESTVDDGSWKRKRKQRRNKGNDIPNEHGGVEDLACSSISRETVCVSGKPLEQKQEHDKGNVNPDTIVGSVESTLPNLRAAVCISPTETNGECMDVHVGEDGLARHFNPKEMVLADKPVDDENSKSKKQRRKKRKDELPMMIDMDRNVIKPNDPDYCSSFAVPDNNAVIKDSGAIQIH